MLMRFQEQRKDFPLLKVKQDVDAGAFMPSCSLRGSGKVDSLFGVFVLCSLGGCPPMERLFSHLPNVQTHVKKEEKTQY